MPYQSSGPILDPSRGFDPFCLECNRVFYFESEYVCRHDARGVLYWVCIGSHIQPGDITSPRYEDPVDECPHGVSGKYACRYCELGL